MVFSPESFWAGVLAATLGWAVGLWLANRPPRVNVPPKVGHVWCSRYNGSLIEVTEVRITDTGSTHVVVRRDGNLIAEPYSYSLSDWERRIRAERRTLLSPAEERALHAIHN